MHRRWVVTRLCCRIGRRRQLFVAVNAILIEGEKNMCDDETDDKWGPVVRARPIVVLLFPRRHGRLFDNAVACTPTDRPIRLPLSRNIRIRHTYAGTVIF